MTEPKDSYAKNSGEVPEIPVGKTETGHPLMRTRRDFFKGSTDVPRSRKPGSYEEALN